MPFQLYRDWRRKVAKRRNAAKRCPPALREPAATERHTLQMRQFMYAQNVLEGEKVLLSQCREPDLAVVQANFAMYNEAYGTAEVVYGSCLVELWQSTVLAALSDEDRATYRSLLDLRNAEKAQQEQEAREWRLRRSFVGAGRTDQHAIAVAPSGDITE